MFLAAWSTLYEQASWAPDGNSRLLHQPGMGEGADRACRHEAVSENGMLYFAGIQARCCMGSCTDTVLGPLD